MSPVLTLVKCLSSSMSRVVSSKLGFLGKVYPTRYLTTVATTEIQKCSLGESVSYMYFILKKYLNTLLGKNVSYIFSGTVLKTSIL